MAKATRASCSARHGPEPLADAFTLADFRRGCGPAGAAEAAAARPGVRRGDRQHLRRRGALAGAPAPAPLGSGLRPDDERRLYLAIREVLNEAIARRGSSIDDYTAPQGDGEMQEHLTSTSAPAGPAPLRSAAPADRAGAARDAFLLVVPAAAGAERRARRRLLAGATRRSEARRPRGPSSRARARSADRRTRRRGAARARQEAPEPAADGDAQAAAPKTSGAPGRRSRRLTSCDHSLRLTGSAARSGLRHPRPDRGYRARRARGPRRRQRRRQDDPARIVAGREEADGGRVPGQRDLARDADAGGEPRRGVRVGPGGSARPSAVAPPRWSSSRPRSTNSRRRRIGGRAAVRAPPRAVRTLDGYRSTSASTRRSPASASRREDWLADGAVRRRADAGRARPAAGRQPRPAPARRADEPPGPRGARVAGGVAPRGAGALVVASHDRAFLDAMVSRIWELRERRLDGLPGLLLRLLAQRADRDARLRKDVEAGDDAIATELDLIQKYRNQRKHGKMHEHERRLEQLDAGRGAEAGPQLALPTRRCSGRRPVALGARSSSRSRTSSGSTPDGRGGDPVVRARRLEATRGERIGIVGPNGAGKTTLLRTIAGTSRRSMGSYGSGQRCSRLPGAVARRRDPRDNGPRRAARRCAAAGGRGARRTSRGSCSAATTSSSRSESVRRRALTAGAGAARRHVGQPPAARRADEPPRHPGARGARVVPARDGRRRCSSSATTGACWRSSANGCGSWRLGEGTGPVGRPFDGGLSRLARGGHGRLARVARPTGARPRSAFMAAARVRRGPPRRDASTPRAGRGSDAACRCGAERRASAPRRPRRGWRRGVAPAQPDRCRRTPTAARRSRRGRHGPARAAQEPPGAGTRRPQPQSTSWSCGGSRSELADVDMALAAAEEAWLALEERAP